jgi:hypothetical protein
LRTASVAGAAATSARALWPQNAAVRAIAIATVERNVLRIDNSL